jgi:deoxyribodipyrimidine photo-lyase
MPKPTPARRSTGHATRIMWFRRDLRLADNPALLAAADGSEVLPVFVLDPRLLGAAGAPRLTFLAGALADLQARCGLLVLRGDPAVLLPELAAAVGADQVHVAADFGPYGAERDTRVEVVLGPVALVRTGSSYAVAPGRVRKPDGGAYRVFTPFHRAWLQHGWRPPAGPGDDVRWASPPQGWQGRRTTLAAGPTEHPCELPELPEATEAAALQAWRTWLHGDLGGLAGYDVDRDRPDLDRSSRLSAYLRWGLLHPRTLLAELGEPGPGERTRSSDTYRKELCWREFYADVLHHAPHSAHDWWDPRWKSMQVDSDPARLCAWQEGRTGYPFVDAGMRQLLAQGWMHNRVRMVAASFLVKDLHLDWRLGARHFMRHLVDADLASNQHGWQWVAGSGTDASPYFRVFNPVAQGLRFDPRGDYVRRWVPELAGIAGPAVHEPWKSLHRSENLSYPAPIVDHAAERQVALERYGQLRGS